MHQIARPLEFFENTRKHGARVDLAKARNILKQEYARLVVCKEADNVHKKPTPLILKSGLCAALGEWLTGKS